MVYKRHAGVGGRYNEVLKQYPPVLQACDIITLCGLTIAAVRTTLYMVTEHAWHALCLLIGNMHELTKDKNGVFLVLP